MMKCCRWGRSLYVYDTILASLLPSPLFSPTFSSKLFQVGHSQLLVLWCFCQPLEDHIILEKQHMKTWWSTRTEVPWGYEAGVLARHTYGSFAVEAELSAGGPHHHRHALAVTVGTNRGAEGLRRQTSSMATKRWTGLGRVCTPNFFSLLHIAHIVNNVPHIAHFNWLTFFYIYRLVLPT